MPVDHRKWLDKQIRAAVDIGINPLDATRAAQTLLALLPVGADPDTYILPAQALEQDISDPALAQDALVAFVASEDVPSQFKLILAAGNANG